MRLIIVSNRLPVTAAEKNGVLTYTGSSGGLATGLMTFLGHLETTKFGFSDYIWLGWPGSTIEEKYRKNLKRELLDKHHCYPVFLSDKEMDNFYEGFCNDTLWPLFHYFPSYTIYNEEYWSYYRKANATFFNALMEIVKPDDVVWIHDYHLMLLPGLLRNKLQNISIGFFLHIPFPSFEIYRLLPNTWRREILEGLLASDLIGFHTHDYSQYFLRCARRILSYEHDIGKVHVNNRVAKVDTFPMGVDFDKFHSSINDPETKRIAEGYRRLLGDSKVILSMDRLDYTKGILNRLEGYEMFLRKNPEWRGRVVLICLVVPSRMGVDQYQQMKRQIDETIGKINGNFGTINWTPILYQFKNLSFSSIAALYNLSDIALVTPLRDGMNLVAKEYMASRAEKTGVLILSEMAGAARELGEAIIINPFYIEEIATAMKEALEMPKLEQIKRNQSMQARLERYDIMKWAQDFIGTIFSFRNEQEKLSLKLLSPNIIKQLVSEFKSARMRLLFLDYDGTLVPFADTPQRAEPDEELIKLLVKLSNIDDNEVVIISGRDRAFLQNWFGSLNVNLIAEHGAWIRERDGEWKMIKQLTNDWKVEILPFLEMYTDRLSGSFVEHKDLSLVWHFRNADPELSSIRVRELVDNLLDFTVHRDLQIVEGNKVVEIKNAGISKGITAQHFISGRAADFILAMGDDRTDEDLFKILPEGAYSVKVGLTKSNARYNISSHIDSRKLLEKLTR
jgi:trehalose 6-phosphate synthase/phosphatase